MSVTTDEQKLDAALELACTPPVKVGGPVSEVGKKIVEVATITRAVVGQLKFKGLSAGQILSVLVLIGTFIAEHGDDIQAIVSAVLTLFNKQA